MTRVGRVLNPPLPHRRDPGATISGTFVTDYLSLYKKEYICHFSRQFLISDRQAVLSGSHFAYRLKLANCQVAAGVSLRQLRLSATATNLPWLAEKTPDFRSYLMSKYLMAGIACPGKILSRARFTRRLMVRITHPTRAWFPVSPLDPITPACRTLLGGSIKFLRGLNDSGILRKRHCLLP
jgi:hypothetical protein